MDRADILLDRSLQNSAFESWRLVGGPGFVDGRSDVALPGSLKSADTASIDYLHTRAAVLRNHLLHSQGRLFAFTSEHGQQLPAHNFVLSEVVQGSCSGDVALISVQEITEPLSVAISSPPMDPSLAVIDVSTARLPSLAEAPSASGQLPSTDPPPAATDASDLLLVSLGRGDLQLLCPQQQHSSNTLHLNLHPHLGLDTPTTATTTAATLTSSSADASTTGSYSSCRPFSLESAYMLPSGLLRCVLWVLLSKQEGVQEPCCDVFLVTLSVSGIPHLTAAGRDAQHAVQDNAACLGTPSAVSLALHSFQLLRRAALPPHLVMVHPQKDEVLLGLDPNNTAEAEGGDRAAPAAAAPAAAGLGLAEAVGYQHSRGMECGDDDDDDVDPALLAAAAARLADMASSGGGPSHDATSSGGGTSSSQAQVAVVHPKWTRAHDDDEECDVDPRTLADAAARLAKYTTEGDANQAPPPPCQQWADVYKETGPDGLGGMGSEPLLDLMVVQAAPASAATTAAAAAATVAAAAARVSGTEACVDVSSQEVMHFVHGPAPTWHVSCAASRLLSCETGSQGLVGLSDDVDCAVMRLGWISSSGDVPFTSEAAASAPAFAKHECYIPALAYVIAGKLQRKHLLLGDPRGDIAAVLVEGKRFAYIYGTASGAVERHGRQEVLDMELCDGESVMGARLVQPQADDAAPPFSPPRWDVAGSSCRSKGPMLLLLLTQTRLIVIRLRAQ